MRFLAIDLGDKRTGLALGDDQTGPDLVSPLEVLEVPIGARGGEELLGVLVRAADEHLGPAKAPGQARGWGGASEAPAIVFGLPLNMDGTESPRSRMVREFAARFAAVGGRVVHFQDERLSSVDAEWSLNRSGLTHGQKKKRRDALAAAAILRDFLRARRTPPVDHPPGSDELA